MSFKIGSSINRAGFGHKYEARYMEIYNRFIYAHFAAHDVQYSDHDPTESWKLRGGGMPPKYHGKVGVSFNAVIGRLHISLYQNWDWGKITTDYKKIEAFAHRKF